MKKLLFLLLIIGVIIGCSRKQYISKPVAALHDTVYIKVQIPPFIPVETTNPIDSILYDAHTAGTPNFNLRKPNFVIIHHTAQDSCGQTFYTFRLMRTKVSAHYVICKDGTVSHILSNYLRAWHAGISKWGNITDINSVSIGIELDNNGYEPFPEKQINSLLFLLDTLKRTYNIPPTNFIGHADIAPIRKDDPSVFFPWKLLAQKGYGLWQDSIPPTLTIDSSFKPMEALRIIGYSTKDTTKAIIAFKRHFLQDTTPSLKEQDKKVLYTLYKKYL